MTLSALERRDSRAKFYRQISAGVRPYCLTQFRVGDGQFSMGTATLPTQGDGAPPYPILDFLTYGRIRFKLERRTEIGT